jgi:hypothetical protein
MEMWTYPVSSAQSEAVAGHQVKWINAHDMFSLVYASVAVETVGVGDGTSTPLPTYLTLTITRPDGTLYPFNTAYGPVERRLVYYPEGGDGDKKVWMWPARYEPSVLGADIAEGVWTYTFNAYDSEGGALLSSAVKTVTVRHVETAARPRLSSITARSPLRVRAGDKNVSQKVTVRLYDPDQVAGEVSVVDTASVRIPPELRRTCRRKVHGQPLRSRREGAYLTLTYALHELCNVPGRHQVKVNATWPRWVPFRDAIDETQWTIGIPSAAKYRLTRVGR